MYSGNQGQNFGGPPPPPLPNAMTAQQPMPLVNLQMQQMLNYQQQQHQAQQQQQQQQQQQIQIQMHMQMQQHAAAAAAANQHWQQAAYFNMSNPPTMPPHAAGMSHHMTGAPFMYQVNNVGLNQYSLPPPPLPAVVAPSQLPPSQPPSSQTLAQPQPQPPPQPPSQLPPQPPPQPSSQTQPQAQSQPAATVISNVVAPLMQIDCSQASSHLQQQQQQHTASIAPSETGQALKASYSTGELRDVNRESIESDPSEAKLCIIRFDKQTPAFLLDRIAQCVSSAQHRADERLRKNESGDCDEKANAPLAASIIEIQTTDYNHGLSAPTTSTSSSAPTNVSAAAVAASAVPTAVTGRGVVASFSSASVNQPFKRDPAAFYSPSSASLSVPATNYSGQYSSNKQYQQQQQQQQQHQQQAPPPQSLLSMKLSASSNELSLNTSFNSSMSDLSSTFSGAGGGSGSKKAASANLFPILSADEPYSPSSTERNSFPSTQLSWDNSNTATNQIISIQSLLHKPGRDRRPPKLVIFLRGPPGSGKSFLTSLIKQEEEKHVSASAKPKVLSIDNYFITEQEDTSSSRRQIMMKYEYDKSMDATYQRSLIKSFKKTVDDNLFSFILVDMCNELIAPLDEMSEHARAKAFHVYVAELAEFNAAICFGRNVHNRDLRDIQEIIARWQPLPIHYTKVDASFFLQTGQQEIEQVEMQTDETTGNDSGESSSSTTAATKRWDIDEIDQQSRYSEPKKSKWELLYEKNSDQMDGLVKKKVKTSTSLDDLNSFYGGGVRGDGESTDRHQQNTSSGKKSVKWLDTEEQKNIQKQRDIGFVIGRSEEEKRKLAGDYVPSLERFKYI